MKRKLLYLCALLTSLGMWAQTDVTSTYITNPSFETDGSTNLDKANTAPSSWIVSGDKDKFELHNSSSETDNNFGPTSASAGDYYYYLRRGWAGGTAKLSQIISSLPAGYYTLTAKVKTMYANTATSSYFLSGNGVNASATTFTVGSTNGFNSLAWSTATVSFSLTEAKENVELAINMSWVSSGSQIAIDDIHLTVDYFATAADYDALDAAIATAESKVLGFETGEYAPYNNATALVALTAAKALDRSIPQSQSTIQGYTTALSSWTANVARVNAFYRGDFGDYSNSDLVGDNSRATAIGWSNTNLANCGVLGLRSSEPAQGGTTDNQGLDGLTSKKALYLRGGYSTTYGSTTGYTVPLKADAVYTLSFTYGGWGQNMSNAGTVTVIDGNSETVLSQSVNTTGTANSDKNAWQTFNKKFKTNGAGDYTIDLNFVVGGQSAFSDFSLLFDSYMIKAVAEELPTEDMVADKWYYYNLPTSDDYEFTSSSAATLTYTQDGTQAESEATGTDEVFTAGQKKTISSLSDGRIYVKSNVATTLSISYKYNVGSATADKSYIQTGNTVTVAWADASTNDPGATFGKNGTPTITFNGNAVDITPTSTGFTFVVPTGLSVATEYTLSIPDDAFGYAAGSVYNAAQDITFNTPLVFDGTYFLKVENDGDLNGEYLSTGGGSGVRAVLDKKGLAIVVATDDQNKTTLKRYDTGNFYGMDSNGYDCWTDRTENNDYLRYNLVASNNPFDGKFLIHGYTTSANHYFKYNTVDIHEYDNGATVVWADGIGIDGDDYHAIRFVAVPVSHTASLKVSDGKLGTFIAPFNVTLPENVKAYSAVADESKVTLTKIAGGGETLGAGIPAIIYGDGTSVDETVYGVPSVEVSNKTVGALTGILDDSDKGIDAGKYVLQTQGGTQAFYQLESAATGKLNRCYVTAGTNEARLVISIDGETAINAIEEADAKAAGLKDGKFFLNGKIVIVRNGVKYSVNGQKLN